ncbi:MAG: hypothetical protein KGI79_01755, partial [Patescibacteria group bacterium]|nr:hypothetical protein [Patescibacteria group bacterium]
MRFSKSSSIDHQVAGRRGAIYGGFFHALEKPSTAQKMIDRIAIPNYPVIFDIEGEEFIARDDLTVRQEILVLSSAEKRNLDFLFSKTKDDNKSRFNKTVASMVAEK